MNHADKRKYNKLQKRRRQIVLQSKEKDIGTEKLLYLKNCLILLMRETAAFYRKHPEYVQTFANK